MSVFDLPSSIRFYEHVIETSLVPHCIVATAPQRKELDLIRRASEQNLLHAHWLVRTADPLVVSGADKPVSFDEPVSFLLDHTPETRYLDALRRRFFCAEILTGTGLKRRATPSKALLRMDDFDQLLRWCNANSITSFGDLTINHFEQFDEDSSSGDVTDLLPIISWLDELLEEPDFELPKYRHGLKFRVGWAGISAILGVTTRSLAKSQRFEAAFNKRFPLFMEKEGIDPGLVVIRVKDIHPKVASCSSRRRFNGWETLDRLSAKGSLSFDALTFRPDFPQFKFENGGKRTVALYPHDMMRLLSSAARWVILHSPHILNALALRAQSVGETTSYHERVDAMQQELENGWPSDLPKLSLGVGSRFDAGERLPLSKAIAMLFVACSIVIGIFSARRRGEIESLAADCLFTGPTGLMLSVYIEKTLQAVDGIPVPEIVRNAVDLLSRLSAFSRSSMNQPFLFRFKSNFADGKYLLVGMRFANLLVEFATIAGIAPPAGQRVWRLNYHMFRKGFVISFYHGNLWGSFDATSWMLRHTSGDMTAIYMDDDETGATLWLRREVKRLTEQAIADLSESQRTYLRNAKAALKDRENFANLWNERRQEFFVSKMMDIFDGMERPIGGGAARLLDVLKAMEDTAYSRVRLSAVPTNGEGGVRDDVLTEVTEFVATHFLEPVPGVPLYCNFKRGSNADASLANCISSLSYLEEEEVGQRRKPNYAYSGTYPCLTCPLVVILNDNQTAITAKAEEIQTEVERAATPALAKSAQKIVDDIFTFLSDAKKAVDGKQRST